MHLEAYYTELINFRRNDISIVDTKASPHDVEQFLLKKGFTQEPFDLNGIPVDFDISYKKDNIVIRHYGCWYYGSSVLKIVSNEKTR